ncbi:MAG: hypothetical protein KDD47_26970 [Acidobacteria bacterium]|nr:hypothetical protein [Acidobacteriota bacterium]
MATSSYSLASAVEVARLVAALDEAPDKLHSDVTPSVRRLIEIGEPTLDAVLDQMLSESEPTRLRAQRVLEGVTMGPFGFVPGKGWPDPKDEERFRAFWRSLGDLDWKADRRRREEAVALWRRWLAQRDGGGSDHG